MRPFRFGVQATSAASARDWHDVVRRVEELGYSTLFLADHYLGPGPAGADTLYPPQHLAPLSAMASAAAWTTTLRIGCRVFCVDYHVPAVLAKEAATVDLLSDGRLELGIGAGWHASEYRAMGLVFEEPRLRLQKLKEVVALFNAHFSGDQMDLHGQFVDVVGYGGLPRPVQRPRPPIMIGGSKKRVLGFAAQEAEIVSISNVAWADPDPMAEALRRLRFVSEGAPERFDQLDIETSSSYVAVTTEVTETLRRVAPSLRGANPERLRSHPNVLVGPVEAIVDQLLERREVIGVNYITVPAESVDAFAPVVARLAGV